MGRRPRGSGSIHSRSKTKHEIKWRQDGRRRSRIVRGTRDEAARALDNIIAVLAERRHLCGELTVAVAVKQHIDRLELSGYASIAAARSRYRCHVATAPFAAEPLSKLTAPTLAAWRDKLLRRFGAQTVRHLLFLLSGCCRHAMERGLLASNPVAAIRKPAATATRRERVLTLDELDRIEQHPELDEALRWVVLALAGSGLRPGEFLGLDRDDVRLEVGDPHLLVRRSGRRSSALKDRRQRWRRVELFDLALRAFKKLAALRSTLQIKRVTVRRSRWFFPIPAGWLRTDNKLGELLEVLGIEDIHAHDFRGTCATHLLSGSFGRRWSIAEVAAHIGDSQATTQRNYAHLLPSALRQAANETRRDNGRRLVDGGPLGAPKRATTADFSRYEQCTPKPKVAGSRPAWRAERDHSEIRDAALTHRRPIVDQLAQRYLEAAAAGSSDARALSLELAAAVRDELDELLELCTAIEAGEFWDRRANELAAMVRSRRAATDDEEATG